MRAQESGIGIAIAAGVALVVAIAARLGDPGQAAVPPLATAGDPVGDAGPEAGIEALVAGDGGTGGAVEWPVRVRWIALGGGSQPELNQLSLEDDLLRVQDVLGEGGVVLFAGGPGTRAVQVQDDAERGDPLRRALGDLLAWRGGRDARYQPSRLAPHGAATLDALSDALSFALAGGDEPLLLWIAAHGDRGEVPADSTVLLWAGTELAPAALADAIATSGTRRPVRLVITSCFSGGFAELAFSDLDPERGATALDVCGLFATSWDEEASGCDPSPDRAEQEAYSIHLIEALRGLDRAGHDVRAEIDLDGDGAITLLEAHARARADALSFDLPTTMSARLLRALAPREGAERAVALPEEEIVLRRIGARLRIADEHDAQARLDGLARRQVELEAAFEEVQARSDALWWSVVGDLLSRWPVIDDPWHPDFEPTLVREGAAIHSFLESSRDRAAWQQAEEDLAAMEHTLAALRIEAAPLRRWLEAHETLTLASRLRAIGGERWERYQRMRACEATAP